MGRLDSTQPSRSCLILGDGEDKTPTVDRVQAITHETAQIAYLAACSTADPGARELIDEKIYLANTFQPEGFVIWSGPCGVPMILRQLR